MIDFRYQQHHKAKRGDNGSGQNRTGKSGDDLILKVPLGTQVFEEDNKPLIFDFIKASKSISGPLIILNLPTNKIYLEGKFNLE